MSRFDGVCNSITFLLQTNTAAVGCMNNSTYDPAQLFTACAAFVEDESHCWYRVP